VQLATEQGLAAARAEALGLLALEAARFGAEGDDDELLQVAEASANEVKTLMEALPGRPPWGAQAEAALGLVELARGNSEQAVGHAMAAVQALMESLHEDTHFEIAVPIAKVVMAAGNAEQQGMVQFFLRMFLAMAAQRTLDADVRAKWFRAPVGRQLVELAGSLEGFVMGPQEADGDGQVDEGSVELLRLLTEGLTNREIAERLGEDEVTVSRRLAELFARIGAPSRSEATAYAFRERVV
jgi:DNA-binding CsgD family transcriptional regulator